MPWFLLVGWSWGEGEGELRMFDSVDGTAKPEARRSRKPVIQS